MRSSVKLTIEREIKENLGKRRSGVSDCMARQLSITESLNNLPDPATYVAKTLYERFVAGKFSH